MEDREEARFRLEYLVEGGRRRWRAFAEVEAPFLARSASVLAAVPNPFPPGCEVFEGMLEAAFAPGLPVEVLPWKPFVPCRALALGMGPGFVARVQGSPKARKVWASEDGWTWMHVPGDRALP